MTSPRDQFEDEQARVEREWVWLNEEFGPLVLAAAEDPDRFVSDPDEYQRDREVTSILQRKEFFR